MLVQSYLQKQLSILPEPIPGSIRDVEALKKLAALSQLTITSTTLLENGRPALSQYFAVQDQTLATKREVLHIAGSLAATSRHLECQAIARAAQESGLMLREMETDILPDGVVGKLERTWYVLGTVSYLESEGIELGVSSQALCVQLENEGKEIIFLAQKQPKRLLAIFACTTPLHPEASQVVGRLHKLGVDLILLTDQKTLIAKGIGRPLGIHLIHSELQDTEKKEIMQSLSERNERVGFFANQRTLALVPESGFLLFQGKRLQPRASILVRDLTHLPLQIEQARRILARARKRFFWCKI